MRKHWLVILTLAILFLLVHLPCPVAAEMNVPTDLNTGPYVDKIIYKVIKNQAEQIRALQAGDVETIASFIDPVYCEILDEDINIDIYNVSINRYHDITINCAKYPLNISGLRRAFAYAFDKTRVAKDFWEENGRLHDSVVPYANGWCIEDELPWHYYDAESDIGNAILDSLDFFIDPESGYRLAPNGSKFDIVFEYNYVSWDLSIPQATVEALESLHINASYTFTNWEELNARLDSHQDYDMAIHSCRFQTYDVDWLAYEYWSEHANTPYQNPTNFMNATYDSYRDALLYGTTYQEVYNAAAAMQEILQYNVPRLVVFMPTYQQAYRNDRFSGHIEDIGRGISDIWTMRKIHHIDGTWGGTVPIAISKEPDSFNIFHTTNPSSATILENLWPSL